LLKKAADELEQKIQKENIDRIEREKQKALIEENKPHVAFRAKLLIEKEEQRKQKEVI
jgi:hypothetical protein